MPIFTIKEVVKVYMAYEYEVTADTKEEAKSLYEESLAGSLIQSNDYISDDTEESVTVV